MLFRKRKIRESTGSDAKEKVDADAATTKLPKQVSTADTAHLIGPGCVRLVGRVPEWQAVSGTRLQLHPEYLRRVLCYGNVDFSSAVLRQFWRRGIQVVFLSPGGNRLLGKLQPAGNLPNLPRLQHLAASDSEFCLKISKKIVNDKIESALAAIRYYQRQGRVKGIDIRGKVKGLKKLQLQVESAQSVAKLRGLEGVAAGRWFAFLPELLPEGWEFPRRAMRPPTDPVNSMLSLGYSLAHHRCETLLAAADLDPRVGFLHELRSGRSSLACDLVEPLRIELVDRMVLGLISQGIVTRDAFQLQGKACRFRPEHFKKFLASFEHFFDNPKRLPTFQDQTLRRIDDWTTLIRQRLEPSQEGST